jgi:hypothetical protein
MHWPVSSKLSLRYLYRREKETGVFSHASSLSPVGVLMRLIFLDGIFWEGVFLAVVFLAGVFLLVAFLVGVSLTGVFFLAVVLVTVFFGPVFWADLELAFVVFGFVFFGVASNLTFFAFGCMNPLPRRRLGMVKS